MRYHLLTGATGLLGSYLLLDGLRAGHRMAVLARPSRSESARGRVEGIIAGWEKEHGCLLPRPVVFEGDLWEVDLGLDARSAQWIFENCESVVHSAASLAFHGTDRGGEPWRTNVEGTRRLLELCRRGGIGRFHYVSTAYVCGLRKGLILESELDLGQGAANEYERSKLEAEKLVRGADFLEPPTIYRPAIIVGDSRSGRTTAFHGFYAILKLAHTLVGKVALGVTSGELLTTRLGLGGWERKHFVPVDWVSAVITHIRARPEHHGTTYHLTARCPTPVSEMASVIQEAVETCSPSADPCDQFHQDGAWFERTFREQMGFYRSYWCDDPDFDLTHTRRAAPHLPCPRVDREMLLKMARFAIRTNFGRRQPRPITPPFDVRGHLHTLLRMEEICSEDSLRQATVGLDVSGPGGGQWELALHGGRLVAANEGLTQQCRAVFRLSSGTFQQLVTRQFTVQEAIGAGHVRVEGDGWEPTQLKAVLEATTGRPYQRFSESSTT